MRASLSWDGERLGGFPPQILASQGNLIVAQRVAMNRGLAGLVGAAVADYRAADDDTGLFGLCFCSGDCCCNSVGIGAFDGANNVPAVGLESLGHVLAEGDVGAALDGDIVVIVEHDQLAEPHGTGHGCGLRCDALLEVAVGDYGVGVVVNDLVAGLVVPAGQPALG